MKTCKLCNKKIYRRGLCNSHYRQALKNGSIKRIKINGVRSLCKIDGCNDIVQGNGFCKNHYQRLRRYGRLENVTARGISDWKEIINKHIVIDKEADCWVWKGTKNRYPRIYINGQHIGASRYILEQKLGRKIKEGYCACHSCDNPRCCNPEHLWEGTVEDNNNDKAKKGRGGVAKLTGKQVLEVRIANTNRGTKTRNDIMLLYAKKYSVSKYTIRNVLDRLRWKWL